jgi:AcrR family transcriptional regulator
MPRAQRQQLILDVAGPVFAQRGYHAASMDEIAELAGVSKPMIYMYFGSKEGLYVAYIDRTGRELLERLNQAGEVPGRNPFIAPINEFLAFVEEHRAGWTVLFREQASSRPVAEEVATLRLQIVETIRRMIEQGGVPLTPAEAIAHAIVGAGESLANWWLKHPQIAREQVADWYLEVVQAAVGAAIRHRAADR